MKFFKNDEDTKAKKRSPRKIWTAGFYFAARFQYPDAGIAIAEELIVPNITRKLMFITFFMMVLALFSIPSKAGVLILAHLPI